LCLLFPFPYIHQGTRHPRPLRLLLSPLLHKIHNTRQLCINNIHYTTSAMQHPLTELSIKKNRLKHVPNKNVKSSLHGERPAFTLRQLYLCCLPNVQEAGYAPEPVWQPRPSTPYHQLPQGLPLL
jgi:hypothetical protein